MCEVHWTEYFQRLGPPIIALLVAYIAYQQWRVSRQTFREKLFDRRFAVFDETQLFIHEIIKSGKVDPVNIRDYSRRFRRAAFLFDRKMLDYLEKIFKCACDMNTFAMMLEADHLSEDERKAYVKKHMDELSWLMEQFEVLYEKFRPYLNLEENRL
ncbi:hypothetical protein KO516_06340 [Citreicella sp. C3M06]|uniref:hypothetical protein n=1 Tax=Citreicella sp. C3M06 TaxID=2841564 RepID=UPI001C090135|nr:hypothetical protein [Citreicella sp. C3M06]MBU2960440.1 hypothetical protein [Citreicella sp. C3M06]